jgi:energy-coupling factor transporter ATP-binding protein EcfA2
MTTAGRLLWLTDYAAAAQAGGTSPAPARLVHGIRLEHLGFSYPGEPAPVLTDVNLDLAAGSTVALAGENGAGKSTLVKLLTGMCRPSSGQTPGPAAGRPGRAHREPGRAQRGGPVHPGRRGRPAARRGGRHDHRAGLAPLFQRAHGRPDRRPGRGPGRRDRRPRGAAGPAGIYAELFTLQAEGYLGR